MVLQERYRASERLACRVVGQHRSTQRRSVDVVDLEEAKLRHRLREIAAEHIRWGRRMAYRLLRREEPAAANASQAEACPACRRLSSAPSG